MDDEIRCNKCGSIEIKQTGTDAEDNIDYYKCEDCGNDFAEPNYGIF